MTELASEKKKKVKTVLFENKVEIVNERLWELSKVKWCVGMVLKGIDLEACGSEKWIAGGRRVWCGL
jgi:hypothetical protein